MLFTGITRLLKANSCRISQSYAAPVKNLTRNSRFFHTAKHRLQEAAPKPSSVPGANAIKPNRKIWRRIFLYGTVIPSASFFAYYMSLSDKDKRKVRVVVESLGRAVRSAQVMLTIAADYKWNLWGLDEVCLDSHFFERRIFIFKTFVRF